MTLLLLSWLAGVLTIAAPCVLPMVPFVLTRADRPFLRHGLPMLAGMAGTFAVVASLAAVGGDWAAEANERGRQLALLVLGLMGLNLLWPGLARRWTRPLVALGVRLDQVATARQIAASGTSGAPGTAAIPAAGQTQPPIWPSLLLGVATGLIWTPCAGPVLGVVLSTAALSGASVRTSALLLAYGAGAATSLGLALWAGGRVFGWMKRSLGVGEWLRRALGVTVLVSVGAIAWGLDIGIATPLTSGGGVRIEQHLLDGLVRAKPGPQTPSPGPALAPHAAPLASASWDPSALHLAALSDSDPAPLPVEGLMPPLEGLNGWLNSAPLTLEALRGKVVLLEFWTFGCYNCRNVLPHVRDWHAKYRDQGLVVIGVHAPEFAYERKLDNVRDAVKNLGVVWPVAIDNDFALWRAFGNRYWPANYFIDARGRIRFHHFGEGAYDRSEQVIRQLLDEARRDAARGTS